MEAARRFAGLQSANAIDVGPGAGGDVLPVNGLKTTEAGGTDTFTVVLNSQPTADVTIGLSSSDPAEGGVASTGPATCWSRNARTP